MERVLYSCIGTTDPVRGQLQRVCTWELRSPAAFKQGGVCLR